MLLDQDFGGSFLLIVYCGVFSCRVEGSYTMIWSEKQAGAPESPPGDSAGDSRDAALRRFTRCFICLLPRAKNQEKKVWGCGKIMSRHPLQRESQKDNKYINMPLCDLIHIHVLAMQFSICFHPLS